MANFEYGQQDLGISNPFRLEGAMMALRGALILPLGAILAFQIKNATYHHDFVLGTTQAIGSIFLLSIALWALGFGLYRTFRFYVGRNVPRNLAPPVSGLVAGKNAQVSNEKINSQNSNQDDTSGIYLYQYDTLEQMLYDRKNTTFKEPIGWMSRGIHSLMPRLIVMPAPIRHLTITIIEQTVSTVVVLLLFGLALLSGEVGLTDLTSNSAIGWLAWFVFWEIFAIWFLSTAAPKGRWRKAQIREVAKDFSWKWFAGWIFIAIAVPSILATQNNNTMPSPLESALPWMFSTIGLGAIIFSLAAFLIFSRMNSAQPVTEVSESRDHWQETINPMDIFRHFDMLMADQRVLELQNRVYNNIMPDLFRRGGENKGEFEGDWIVETQPMYINRTSPGVHLGRMIGSAAGNLLAAAGAVWLFFAVGEISQAINMIFKLDQASSGLVTLFNGIAGPILLMTFGRMLIELSRLYWSEIAFESTLVRFNANGTYTESKLTTGNAVLDSTRSENTLVRSNLTPWFQVSRLLTVTFARTGLSSFSGTRMIMEMHKHDDFISTLLTGMQSFLRSRRNIADLGVNDVRSVAGIQEINDASLLHNEQAQSAGLRDAEKLGAIARKRNENNQPGEREE